MAKFTINNLAINISLFIANYSWELRIGTDIRRKENVEKTTEFAERIKKIQEEKEMVLKKT